MKKRIITVLLALTLLLCLSVSVFAESQLWNITDDAGLLSDEEYTQLESYAESVSETYGVGVYVITIDNYEDYYDSPYETAWQFYHEYTLGEGDDRDGIILLLSMDNRQFANFVYGPKADYAFDEHGVLELNDWYLDDFRNDDWAGGLNHFVAGCEDFLAKAARPPQHDRSHSSHHPRLDGLRADRLPHSQGQDEIRPRRYARKRLCRRRAQRHGQPRPVHPHHRNPDED